MPLDVAALRPDFVVSVGYKWLLGPFGRGYLWVAEEHREGRPLEENWILRAGSDDFARLVDYRDEYLPGARRYDQGARTLFEITPMAVAALEQILAWGPPRIASSQPYSTAWTRSPQPSPMMRARSSPDVVSRTHAIARGHCRGNQ